MDERNNKKIRIYDKYFMDTNNKQIDELLPKLDKLQSQIDILTDDLYHISESITQFKHSICFFKKNSNKKNVYGEINEEFQEKLYDIFSISFYEFQKNTENINKDFIELKQIYKNIINTLIFPPLKIENLSSFEVENKMNNSYKYFNPPIFGIIIDKNSANLNVNDNEVQKEYLKCIKCKKNAEILCKNNYYCKTCYLNEAVFYEEDKILDKNNPNNMKNEK